MFGDRLYELGVDEGGENVKHGKVLLTGMEEHVLIKSENG